MFNKSFFPTPAEVALEMLSRIPAKELAGRRILEPSAGKIDSITKALMYGKLLDSEYFQFRAFKKGTLHLYFKDESLWEMFNIEAARGKNWLPDDTKAREKEERKAARESEKATEATPESGTAKQLHLSLAS